MSSRRRVDSDPTPPRTIVWQHFYQGRLRWAIPNLVIEETPEQIVSLLMPGTICKAPTSYGKVGYVQQLLDGWEVGDFTWHWKDWDELVEAEQVGIFTKAEADAIRAAGQRVVDSLGTLLPTGWESWQPDPVWPLLALPDGWDRT